jgi:hypothetical protein
MADIDLSKIKVTLDEAWKLWDYHHDAQYAAANKEDYDEAKFHAARAKEIRKILKPEES